MKTYPLGLDQLLATGAYTVADLYDFQLMWDNSHLYYTSFDTDVFNGVTYTSKGPYFDKVQSQARWHQKVGLDPDTWQVLVAPAVADPITGVAFPAKIYGQPWMFAARVGVLDGATVRIHRAYWPSNPTRPFVMENAFDPSKIGPNAALSNSNMLAYHPTGPTGIVNGNAVALVTAGASTGKFYWETSFTHTGFPSGGVGGGNSIAVGICAPAAASGLYIGVDANGISYFSNNNGEFFTNGGTIATNLGGFGDGDVVRVAADFGARLMWVAINNGNWNGNASANPATGTLGQSFSGLPAGTLYPAADAYLTGVQITINMSPAFGTPFAFAVPSGFGTLGQQSPTLGVIPQYVLQNLFVGRVGQIQCGRSQAIITMNSWVEVLQRPMPKNVFGAPCRWTLFDVGCTLSRAAFAFHGTVVSVIDDGNFIITGTNPSSYFALGALTFNTGNNAPLSFLIREHVAPMQQIRLLYPAPYVIHAGDTFTAYPGCDKSFGTCQGKFNNLVNFGGQPFIPMPELAL